MQVQFNRPVTIGKFTYGKGQHSVPSKDLENNWFFDAMLKEGSAFILRPEAPVPVEPSAPESGALEIPAMTDDISSETVKRKLGKIK